MASPSISHDHIDDGRVHAHIASTRFYVGIFAALIVLTFITVGVSYLDLGSANAVVAVLVATIKASLVAAFFMHLVHDKPFNTVALIGAFLFLGLFLFLTMEDDTHRNRIDEANGTHVLPSKGEVAPGGMPANLVPALSGAHESGEHAETAPKHQ